MQIVLSFPSLSFHWLPSLLWGGLCMSSVLVLPLMGKSALRRVWVQNICLCTCISVPWTAAYSWPVQGILRSSYMYTVVVSYDIISLTNSRLMWLWYCGDIEFPQPITLVFPLHSGMHDISQHTIVTVFGRKPFKVLMGCLSHSESATWLQWYHATRP